MIQWVERATGIDENDTECHRIMCRIALIQAKYARSEHHLECALADGLRWTVTQFLSVLMWVVPAKKFGLATGRRRIGIDCHS